MASQEQMVMVVGPGHAFGQELCESIASEGLLVQVLSRHRPEYVDDDRIRWQWADITREGTEDVVRDVSKGCQLRSVVFAATSSNCKTIEDRDSLLARDVLLGLGLRRVYLGARDALRGGRFVVVGGNFAEEPDPEHFGLSLNKMVVSGLTKLIRPDADKYGILVNELIIKGAAEPKKEAIVKRLSQLVQSHSNGFAPEPSI